MEQIVNNKFVLVGIFGVISVVLLYINNNFIDKKENVDILDYVKIFILGGSISFGTIMLLEMGKSKSKSTPTPLETSSVVENVNKDIPSISQDIHTGNPNF